MAALWINCMQCYFITIATILGTGILGLPVTMSEAGLGPFLFTFFLSFFMQVLVILAMIELLQHSQVFLQSGYRKSRIDTADDEMCEELLLKTRVSNVSDDKDMFEEIPVGSETEETSIVSQNCERTTTMQANLHLLGATFLNKFAVPFYILNLSLHFVSILISYCLAGSEAYGQILNLNYVDVIPVFMWSLTIFILIAQQIVRPIISILTLGKGTMLFITVVVTLYTGFQVNNPVTDDWKHIQGPFLMGTVALGGIPLVMPMLYDKFENKVEHIRGFRNSIIGGLITCFVLNIMWCWAVLSIVPQTRDACLKLILVAHGNINTTEVPLGGDVLCDPDINLKDSDLRGEISTVPATEVILRQHANLKWITTLIQIFIVISISVSYLTLGSSMLHTIAGGVDSFLIKRKWCGQVCCTRCFRRNYIYHSIAGLPAFSLVFVVALADPKGFVKILEKAASFSVNAFCGPFLFFMLSNGRINTKNLGQKITLDTWIFFKYSHYAFGLYYIVAIGYDIVSSIVNIAQK